MARKRARGAKVEFGSGRKTGVPTGRAEGRVHHIVVNKKAAKARPGSRGAKNKFGYSGVNKLAGAQSGQMNFGNAADMLQFKQISQLGSAGKQDDQQQDNSHWHKFKDGRIEKGEASFADGDKITDHITQLGPEHVSRGRAVTFVLADQTEGEGIVEDWGKQGVQVITPEGEPKNVFWPELVLIEPPPKPKRKTPTNKEGRKPVTPGVWGKLSRLLTELKKKAPTQTKVRVRK